MVSFSQPLEMGGEAASLSIMKNWNESEKLFSEIARRAVAGEACALATVIQIDGSTYRRPGAKLLIGAEGALNGNVSGGCLENDVK